MGPNIPKAFGKKCFVFVSACFDAKTTCSFGEGDKFLFIRWILRLVVESPHMKF